MTFSYISFPLPERSRLFGGKILRPIIPIEITIGAITVGYAALIDSGADFCIFDGELGELFGLDVRSGDRLQFNGIQEAEPAQAYLHEIDLAVNGSKRRILAGFSYDIAPNGYGLLGQKGFFDVFAVAFDLVKEKIELNERT